MNKLKKIWIQFTVFLFILLVSLFGYAKYPTFFSLFDNTLNDIMFLNRGPQKTDKDIIIVDIDEKSLQKLGQWPWSRNKIAQILQNLTQSGVGIVGLDVVFAEADNSSPKRILQKLGLSKIKAADYDKILANAIKKNATIIGFVFALDDDGLKEERLPKNRAIFIEKNKPEHSYLIQPHRAILNIPIIQENAYSNGYFNTIPDEDGIVRRIPMVVEYHGILYPSLSLEMIRNILGIKKVFINYSDQGVESIQMGDLNIPTDRWGRMIVNYKGPHYKYKYISAYDVYTKNINSKDLQGKIILFGTSAAGLLDLRSTPFDNAYPGVEVHATAIDNMLNKNFLQSPSWVAGVDIVDIILSLSITFALLLFPSALMSFFLIALFILFIFFLHYHLMIDKGFLLNTFFPLVSVSILFVIGQSINYFFEMRQKENIKRKFSTKVSAAVVEELIQQADENLFSVKEKEITILFSDIRDFTSISEQLGSAKMLIQLLNEYMTPMVEIITSYKGTVDKFIGDAIMAYWNAPADVEKHADKALQSAIEQIFALENLNKKLTQEKKPNIRIGIGINTGLSVVGEMGSKGRSDYTCIGDAVNLASRSEGLCKPYGSKIILSEFTKNALQNSNYFFRELDTVRVKGKKRPVTIFECMGYENRNWVNFNEYSNKIYLEALQYYKNSHFEEALKLFKMLNDLDKEKLYQLYIERCEHYIVHKPKNFDGVFTFVTK